MKTILFGLIGGVLLAGNAMAANAPVEMPPQAKKHQCDSCHAIDERVVGPAWRDVAAKYRGDVSAAERLQIKVSKGGKGTWGSMPMPANDPQGTKQEDIRALIQFILALPAS